MAHKIDLSSLVNSIFETAARYQQSQTPQTQQGKRTRQEPCTPCAANRRLQAAKQKFGVK